jgi:outer membrane lipoprotein-sorting protein
MNRSFKGIIAAISLGMIFGVFAASDTSAQGILRDILGRMDKHNQSLTSLKSDLKMEKKNVQLGENDISEGTLMMLPKTPKRPMYARIDWAKPSPESLALIGDSYQLYSPRRETITVGKTGSSKGAGSALAFLTMSKEQLQANYTIEYLGTEGITGAVQTWHLRLTPKKANGYKSSELWVDKDGMPLQARITASNNDTTTVILTRLKKNEKVDGSLFKINPPKGTKVVKG